jgi:hypothetical protein
MSSIASKGKDVRIIGDQCQVPLVTGQQIRPQDVDVVGEPPDDAASWWSDEIGPPA